MEKIILSVAMILTLLLSACGQTESQKNNPIYVETPPKEIEQPFIRVVFNPMSGDINIPNDLLMMPSTDQALFDFTLNTEGQATFDSSDPQHSLSALDGWSAHTPIEIRVEAGIDMDIDPASINGDAIKLFEATQALQGTSAECQAIATTLQAPGVPCELGSPLIYGVDYICTYLANSHTIRIVPLKVLKSSQGYMLVVTESLKDTLGRAIKGSGSWELVRQNILSNRLQIPELVPLQKIVNYMVAVLEPVGIQRDKLSYAAYFSTQSAGDVLQTIKRQQIAAYAKKYTQTMAQLGDASAALEEASQLLPSIEIDNTSQPQSAFDALFTQLFSHDYRAQLASVGLTNCNALVTAIADVDNAQYDLAVATFAIAGPYCSTSLVSGNVSLPYYLDPKLPKTGWWQAACTSSATLNALGQNVVAQLVEENQVGVNNTLCKRQSNDQLMDLNLASLGINDPRNLTKFNPIPLRKGRQQDEENSQYNEAGTESVEVLFTIPNEDNIALLSAHSNGQIAPVKKPKNGWPVVIFSHGITGNRKDVLALSSTLSMAGIASVAIDHPLHGDRGLTDIDGKFVKIDLASVGDYLNFSSLLTARDNARQSSADILTLRLALNSIIDESNSVELDTSTVHFAAHSLGSITGAVAVAIANDSMTGELSAFDHLYAFSSATLNVPASGVPSYLLESPYFEPLIKGSILAETSRSFRAFLAQFPTGKSMAATPPLRAAYLQFMASVSPEQSALIAAQFDAFRFSSQTILDAADPISYAALLGKNTHVLLQLTVGGGVNDDGSTALSDQVNPVATSLPLVGGQALADLIGLEKVSSSQSTDGVVRFISGDHFSLFSPEASVAATSEMQSQVASFIQLEGQGIQIGNSSVIEN